MKLCIPISENKGLESEIYGHFGSAPQFLLVDCDDLSFSVIKNTNIHHSHGMCHPMTVLQPHKVEAVVVTSIGLGALNKLNASNIEVYKSSFPTVKETIDAFKNNSLSVVTPEAACGHHGQGRMHGQRGMQGNRARRKT